MTPNETSRLVVVIVACRSGCQDPGSHATWGECARAADLQIDRFSLNNDLRREKAKDRHLDTYRQLRADGIQPPSIRPDKLRAFEKTL